MYRAKKIERERERERETEMNERKKMWEKAKNKDEKAQEWQGKQSPEKREFEMKIWAKDGTLNERATKRGRERERERERVDRKHTLFFFCWLETISGLICFS